MPLHAPGRAVAFIATAAVTCTLALVPMTAASAALVPEPVVHTSESPAISLSAIGTYETGVFDASAAEIVAAYGDRLFVVNAQAGAVDVLNYGDPTAIAKEFALTSEGVANSVAIREDGLGVVAMEAPVKTDPGHLLFFDANAADAASAILGTVEVGALPDMVTISKDGLYAVVANEGELADDLSVDPEGSIGVVTLPQTVAAPAQDAVRTADFHAFEEGGSMTLPADVRIFGPTPNGDDLPISRNLEPEYITVDGGTAYAAIQEANAIAVVDLATATVTDIHALGFKDHGAAGNELDPSDRDEGISLRTFPGLKGIYMPDGMQSYQANGETYLVTANEGDAREWGFDANGDEIPGVYYNESVRVNSLAEDGYGPVCEPLAALTGNADLGRLNVTIENGFDETAGCYSELYSFGARSFSIWTTDGELVFDSGSDFEEITATAIPDFFNSNHSESNLEGRSDDKGPEPENVTIGAIGDSTYAFIGFERVGGIAVYDITQPANPQYVTYVNNRDFSQSVEDGGDLATAGDLGPEGVAFVPAESSPTGEPLLVVGNEVSGTTTVFAIEDETTTDITVLTTNDLHGRIEQNLGNGEAGAAVIGGAVDAFEAENPNTLFVSAGDNIGASTFTSFIQQDNPTIDALVAAGLDLGAAGNHEFDAGYADLAGRVTDRFGGPEFTLGANVTFTATGEPALQEYAIEEVDGVRIGFIGTVTAQTASMVNPDLIDEITFGDQLEAANRVAGDLVAGDLADVIVLLTHEGSATGDCTAVAADETVYGDIIRGASADIDAIVSGHTHQKYNCLVPVDGTDTERPVIQAHQYGTTLGKLDISVDSATKELVSITGDLVPLVVDGAAAFPEDPAVKAIVDEAIAVAEEEGAVEVGSITADILRGGTAGSDRGVESTLGNLVADVYLWATSNETFPGTKAQIGIMNPGGLRADLLYGTDGTMTYRDVADVQPFANTLVTVTLTGAQLKAVLEEQWQPEGSSRPKLHLGISDGFSYEYDPDAARGAHIVSMSYMGEEIADTDEFTVVTNSFLAAGGDNFVTFAQGTDRTDTGQIDLTATVQYFEQSSPVAPAALGRAVVADDSVEPQPGTDWATIDIGSGRVEQGGTLDVTVSGLKPGQWISATLFSDPIVIQNIPAADANGVSSFSVAIPADLPVGAHTLIISSEGLEPLSAQVTVLASGDLARTGSELPLGIALAAAFALAMGGMLLMARRRPLAARR